MSFNELNAVEQHFFLHTLSLKNLNAARGGMDSGFRVSTRRRW